MRGNGMYLGVDGGGTRTAFVLVDETGEVGARHEAGGAYYLEIGLEELRARLAAGVRQVAAEAGIRLDDIRHAFFGLPAYGEDLALIDTLDALPARLLPRGNYRCGNDMVCAWAGSLACQDGVNLIAGTGSIGYGRRGDREARSGGWGELFSDEGSAYWIACRGLQLFAKMSDGRAEAGPLLEFVRRKYRLAQDLDLSTLVLERWGADRGRIAAFARVVTEAARAGDEQATSVFAAAAGELAAMADAIRRQLESPAGEILRVSWSGGVFDAGELILGPLATSLEQCSPDFELVSPRYTPALGAAYYAAVLDGCDAIGARLAASGPR
jgi:N-acetylglucosamine kinase-like BadF-type ATPase